MTQIVIDVPEGGEALTRRALAVAAEYAAEQARKAPLRSEKPDTQRYVWFDVATELGHGRQQPGGPL